jgi:fructose-bisphosphate aldolase class I
MNLDVLKETVSKIAQKGKGILAADESTSTCKKRFDALNIEFTEENRRDYREMLFTTPGVEEHISGVILFEETLKQNAKDGTPFFKLLESKGIVPGIKVDKGKVKMEESEEEVTQGLDDLDERYKDYKQYGAKFAKWRAVYHITDELPSEENIKANAEGLADYAKISQENDIVPIVEPEVLINGDHSIQRCYEVTKAVLVAVFEKLKEKGVALEGIILKPSMVISGKDAKDRADREEVAKRTVELFKEVVPEEVPTINFLPGGQSPEEATEHLQKMNEQELPWNLSFSYGRALQEPALEAFSKGDIEKGQKEFYKRAKLNGLANKGEYAPDMENE